MLNISIYRGRQVESNHKVIAAVSDPTGDSIENFGDTDTLIFPRSSMKPIQTLGLILKGAADHYEVNSKELAIASGSHGGEYFHTECVSSWLSRMKLSQFDLECGIHTPSHLESNYQLIRSGKDFTVLHNNCSGKHAGMLCLAQHLKETTKGYVDVGHRVQQVIKSVIEQVLDYDIPDENYGIDGCSIPTWLVPLNKFAMGMARFTGSNFTDKKISNATNRIFEACVNNPEFVAGTGRYCTILMQECDKKVLVKTGAEGVIAAAVKYPRPIGIVVKCLDGSVRASEAAMAYLLNKLKILPDSSILLQKKLFNWNNIEIGHIEIT